MKRFLTAVLCAICALPAAAMDLPAPLVDADFDAPDMAEVVLGQQLFYDPILSGNRNISCATCHHPRFATSDGLALGLGEGGQGLGPARRARSDNPPEQRIPRNSPALFNLGARQVSVLFHDGRIEVDAARASGFRTPMEQEMEQGFDGLLSAQTMFPVLSADEMAGHYQENDVAKAVRQGRITGPGGAWDIISKRVETVPEYAAAFADVYPDTAGARGVAFTDISNAVAAFMAFEWRADNSAFDRHLRGAAALEGASARGMALFYGKAQCATCHAGPLLSDQSFHAMGQPQLGPGKAARFETHARDVGRARVTGREADMYRFRTPMLRNVALTGPWGHAGAFDDLRAFVVHHAGPRDGLGTYARAVVLPPLGGATDWSVMDDSDEVAAIAAAVSQTPVALSAPEIDDLLAFLNALTDATSVEGRLGIPETVPSGLPVER